MSHCIDPACHSRYVAHTRQADGWLLAWCLKCLKRWLTTPRARQIEERRG